MSGPDDAGDRTVPRYLAAGIDEVPADDTWLTAAEAARLSGFAYTKRRTEARLGRWVAKRAVSEVLRSYGWSGGLAELVIRNASDGAPEVFFGGSAAPLHISMTDRADWAVCVVLAGGPHKGGVGCDLELVEPRTARFVADWFTPAEQTVIAERDDHDLFANLIWSAKESALKVLRTGLRRDTRSVEVVLGGEQTDGWGALSVHSVEGGVYPGWWRRAGEFVLTFAASRDLPPPVPIGERCALDSARPGHSWMAAPYTPPTGPVQSGSVSSRVVPLQPRRGPEPAR